MADAALIERARAGERSALDRLLREVRPRLLAVARGILHDDDAAEEATQVALVRVAQRLADFDPARADFAVWTHVIVRSAALDEARVRTRAQREVGGEEAEEEAEAARHGEGVVAPGVAFNAGPLIAALRRLPAAQRVALQLRDIGGLSYDEIGARLGVPARTAGTWIHRARRATGRG